MLCGDVRGGGLGGLPAQPPPASGPPTNGVASRTLDGAVCASRGPTGCWDSACPQPAQGCTLPKSGRWHKMPACPRDGASLQGSSPPVHGGGRNSSLSPPLRVMAHCTAASGASSLLSPATRTWASQPLGKWPLHPLRLRPRHPLFLSPPPPSSTMWPPPSARSRPSLSPSPEPHTCCRPVRRPPHPALGRRPFPPHSPGGGLKSPSVTSLLRSSSNFSSHPNICQKEEGRKE